MYSIIYRNTHEKRIGLISLNEIDKAAFYSDYASALRAFNEEAKHVRQGGMLLMSTLGQKELTQLESPLWANHKSVVRQYLTQGYSQPISTRLSVRQEELNRIKEATKQLETLLENKNLSKYGRQTLDSLNTFISQVQDEYLQQGVLRGLLWKDQAYGKAQEEEQALRLHFPDYARKLGIPFPRTGRKDNT